MQRIFMACGFNMDNEDIKEKINDLNRSIDFSLKKMEEKGNVITKGKHNTIAINNVETFKIKKIVSIKFKNILNSIENDCGEEFCDRILDSNKYNISEIKDVNLKECLMNIQDIIKKIKKRMN